MLYAKYDALDVAEYVLWYCENKLKTPITNLQLQKILYYIQGKSLELYNKPLFDNNIEAWDYGPVIPDVYYEYNRFIANPITGVVPIDTNLFDCDEVKLIESVVNNKFKINVWELVKQTHKETPWKKNYISGLKKQIPISDLIENFKI